MVLVSVLCGALAAASGATVALSPVEALGFDDVDVAGVSMSVDTAVTATGVTVEVGPPIEDACAAVPTCVWERVAVTSSEYLLRVTVFRVGGDVEVTDTLYARSGAVVATGTRSMPTDAFLAAPISPQVRDALEDVSAADDRDPRAGREPSHLPMRLPPAPSKGAIVAGTGGLVAAVSLLGFAFEAATLEDPTSLGSDKERARVTGWVYLGLATVGLAAVGGGIAWAVVDPEPAFSMSETAGDAPAGDAPARDAPAADAPATDAPAADAPAADAPAADAPPPVEPAPTPTPAIDSPPATTDGPR